MKVAVLVFFLYVLLIAVARSAKPATLQTWKSFKKEFNKHYTTPKEEKRRKKIFEQNQDMIIKHNKKYRKGKVSYEMGMNHFGDTTDEEFEAMLCDKRPNNNLGETLRALKGGSIIKSLPPDIGTAPEYKNWTNEGAVTPVKNQDSPLGCGSCWAFAVAGAIESHNFIRSGKLIPLSEQNLLDCVGQHLQTPGNNTCRGGYVQLAFEYVMDNEGIAADESYPYEAEQGPCRYTEANRGATIVDYRRPQPENEELLKSIVGLLGPVTSNIHAAPNLRYHTNGVYKNPKCKNARKNHGVLVVGYGTEGNEPYWLVKNSWGTNQEQNGYFKILRGTNECGIANQTYYPVF